MLTKSRLKRSVSGRAALLLCIDNEGYKVSLELAKFYRVVPDSGAETLRQIRVIDESGEDYLYPADFFVHVHLSPSIRKAVLSAV